MLNSSDHLLNRILTFFYKIFLVAWPGSGARGHKTTRKLFVAYQMTQNGRVIKVYIAETEVQQLLSQNTSIFREATTQNRRQTLCRSKVNCKK